MRVYVLGAGASYHAGYPLASLLGIKLVEWANSQHALHNSLPQYSDIVRRVAERYGDLMGDFEAVLTHLLTADPSSKDHVAEALREYFTLSVDDRHHSTNL